jgi:RHS repeat-associated protein
VQCGTWTPWLTNTSQTQADFLGERDQSYYFHVQATDNVNNASAWVEAGPVTVSAVTKYYYHGGERVAMRQGDVVYYLHSDHLGSTSLTTDITGTVVAETRYLPYGEKRWTNEAQPTDFTFTGQRAERGFALMDYNARYYDPRLGRFISADTVVPEYTHPQSLNRYSYGYNNPVRYYDSDGHCFPFCTMAAAWLAFDYLPRETLAAGSREVAGWGVPGVSDMAATDVYAADQLWLAVNGDELGLTTKQRIDAAGEGYIAAANEAFAIYGVATLAYAAKDTLQTTVLTPEKAAAETSPAVETNVVYRGLAQGEDPTTGLRARAPGAGNSPVSHVAGQRQSQWISTTSWTLAKTTLTTQKSGHWVTVSRRAEIARPQCRVESRHARRQAIGD